MTPDVPSSPIPKAHVLAQPWGTPRDADGASGSSVAPVRAAEGCRNPSGFPPCCCFPVLNTHRAALKDFLCVPISNGSCVCPLFPHGLHRDPALQCPPAAPGWEQSPNPLIVTQSNYFSQLRWGPILSPRLPVNIFPVLSNLPHKGEPGLQLISAEYYSPICQHVNLLSPR